jgi:hypothetical protein
MRTHLKKPLVLVIAAVTVMATAVGAYAYWTSGGGGTGTAATGTSDDLVVVQTSSITNMGPGIGVQTLSGNFDNGNEGPTYVGSVAVVVTDTSDAGCTAADYTIAGSPMLVDDEVPAGNDQGAWGGATIAFANDPDRNQDACQSATVNLTYEIVDTPAP